MGKACEAVSAPKQWSLIGFDMLDGESTLPRFFRKSEVWTSRQCRAEILTLLARHFPTLETLKQPTGETSGWPMDPKELRDVTWRKLLPWRPGLSLAERQVK